MTDVKTQPKSVWPSAGLLTRTNRGAAVIIYYWLLFPIRLEHTADIVSAQKPFAFTEKEGAALAFKVISGDFLKPFSLPNFVLLWRTFHNISIEKSSLTTLSFLQNPMYKILRNKPSQRPSYSSVAFALNYSNCLQPVSLPREPPASPLQQTVLCRQTGGEPKAGGGKTKEQESGPETESTPTLVSTL